MFEDGMVKLSRTSKGVYSNFKDNLNIALAKFGDEMQIAFGFTKKLEVLGLMCIPPFDLDPTPFFNLTKKLNNDLGLEMMSMGMSNDYLDAAKLGATHVRVGSKIFGSRASQ